jgi:hypothetical protein
MRILKNIKPINDIQKIFFDNYKYEMKLAIGVIIAILISDLLFGYNLNPLVLITIISIQVLVFTKYLYDRRTKLLDVLDKTNKLT